MAKDYENLRRGKFSTAVPIKGAKFSTAVSYKDTEKYMRKKQMTEKERYSNRTIDNILTALFAFGSLGLFFSFFSSSGTIGIIPKNVQLAPPMPNYLDYLPFVFFLFLITGGVYFMIKYFKRKEKEYSIPLSF